MPELNEQIEIRKKLDSVKDEIEELFQLDYKNEDYVQKLRQAILKSAFEGKLTEEWRKEHRDTIEPASQLLNDILKGRRKKWERDQLARMKDKGKIPKNNRFKEKYREPLEPVTTGLPKLPSERTWVTLDQITWFVRDGLHFSPEYTEEGVPFITGGNVRPSGVDFANSKHISEELHKKLSKRVKPELGDILYTKGGTTGIARVNTYQQEFSIWVHVALLKLVYPIEPFFVQHALNSPFCYKQSQLLTHGLGNQDLGLTRMIRITLGLPPIQEQKHIVKKVDQLIKLCDNLEAKIKEAQKNCELLMKAVLKEAFAS